MACVDSDCVADCTREDIFDPESCACRNGSAAVCDLPQGGCIWNGGGASLRLCDENCGEAISSCEEHTESEEQSCALDAERMIFISEEIRRNNCRSDCEGFFDFYADGSQQLVQTLGRWGVDPMMESQFCCQFRQEQNKMPTGSCQLGVLQPGEAEGVDRSWVFNLSFSPP